MVSPTNMHTYTSFHFLQTERICIWDVYKLEVGLSLCHWLVVSHHRSFHLLACLLVYISLVSFLHIRAYSISQGNQVNWAFPSSLPTSLHLRTLYTGIIYISRHFLSLRKELTSHELYLGLIVNNVVLSLYVNDDVDDDDDDDDDEFSSSRS